MSGSTKKETIVQQSDPWGPAQPYIIKGMDQTNQTYDANQPTLQKYAGMQLDSYGRLAPGAEQGIIGSQNLVNSTINGDYLQGNPYLQGIINRTNADVTAGVNDQFGPAGRFGSGYHAKILADQLSQNENNLRYANYGQERQNQLNAVQAAQSLMGGSQSLLNNAADLPWVGVGALNGNIRQASGGYGTSTGTSTQTTSGGLGGALVGGLFGAAGSALSNPALFSDERLKQDIEHLHDLEDGLPVYAFSYRQDTPLDLPEGRFIGVMAQDVEELRPWALGPERDGFMTVDYGRL